MSPHQQLFQSELAQLARDLHEGGYLMALKALRYIDQFPHPLRKDGVTPGLHHPVRVAISIYNDRARIEAAGKKLGFTVDQAVTVGILHDIPEENPDVTIEELKYEFDPEVATSAFLLSKVENGVVIPIEQYRPKLLQRPLPIIIKGHDRHDNMQTVRHLPPLKMAAYIPETREIIQIAREAVRLYPPLEDMMDHYTTQIEENIAGCIGWVQVMADSIGDFESKSRAAQIVRAFEERGLLHAPTAPRGSGSTPTPTLAVA